jgi:hypothetical protein
VLHGCPDQLHIVRWWQTSATLLYSLSQDAGKPTAWCWICAIWKDVFLSNHRHRFVNNAELHVINFCITKTVANAPACVRSLISEPCAS